MASKTTMVVAVAVVLGVAAAALAAAGGVDGAGAAEQGSALDQLKDGYLAMEAGEAEAALGHYRAALERADTSELRFQASLGAGAAAATLGRSDEARQFYREALAIKPGHGATMLALGELAQREGDLDEAAARYAEAAVADPELVEALTRLGSLYARQGRFAEAAAACERALERDAVSQAARLCVGVVSFHQGRFAEAEAAFAAVVEASPDHANAWYGLGLSRLSARDQRGALEAYGSLKAVDPDLARDLYERIFPAR